MKNLHFTKGLFSLLLLFVLSTSCEKSTPEEPVSLKQFENVKSLQQVPEVENMVLTNFNDKDVIDLIEKLKPTKLNESITSRSIYKVSFKNLPTLKGFYIKGEETGQVIEDIFYVFETGSKINLFINREKTGFTNKNNKNGYISIRDINNDLLFNDYVEQNRYVMNLNLTNNVFSTNSNSKITFREWDCTRERFNKFYQEAKRECESDWVCDVACSVNPCFISYLAFAVGKCSGLIE
jgi:hypothetical protein